MVAESEWALCLTLSSKQQYLSQGVLPFPNHPYWLWLWTDLPSLLACSRQTQNYPLPVCSFPRFPLFFPFLFLSFSGMKPLTGRWADGDRQCSLGRKLIGRDWERIWICWMVLTWWENRCTLPVYLHHAELRDHGLMLSLLVVIKSFVSTLTPQCDNSAQDWLKRAHQSMWEIGQYTQCFCPFLMTAKCLVYLTYYTYCKMTFWASIHNNHKKKSTCHKIMTWQSSV